MNNTFICSECHAFIPNKFDRYEMRVEFRRIFDQARGRTRKVRDVCRSCMKRLTDKPVMDQEALLP